MGSDEDGAASMDFGPVHMTPNQQQQQHWGAAAASGMDSSSPQHQQHLQHHHDQQGHPAHPELMALDSALSVASQVSLEETGRISKDKHVNP